MVSHESGKSYDVHDPSCKKKRRKKKKRKSLKKDRKKKAF